MKVVGLVTGGHEYHIKIMNENNAQLYYVGKGVKRFINEFLIPDADVYITESNFYAPIIRKLLGKKCKIINIAGSRFIFQNTNPILKWLINKVDLMMVEGKFGEENIRKVGYNGKTQIIYPVCDSFKYTQLMNAERKYDKLKILTIARFDWKMKGLDILEQAIDKLQCEVYVIGVSDYKPKNPFMKMLGTIPENEKLYYMKMCNVYVQPSRFDTFGIAALESAFAGLPIIVSDNCGIKEFIDERFIFIDAPDLMVKLKNIHRYGQTLDFKKYYAVSKNVRCEI